MAKATVTVIVDDGNAIFSSDQFALDMYINLSGQDKLPDNLCDIYPGIPYVLPWNEGEGPKVLYVGNMRKRE